MHQIGVMFVLLDELVGKDREPSRFAWVCGDVQNDLSFVSSVLSDDVQNFKEAYPVAGLRTQADAFFITVSRKDYINPENLGFEFSALFFEVCKELFFGRLGLNVDCFSEVELGFEPSNCFWKGMGIECFVDQFILIF